MRLDGIEDMPLTTAIVENLFYTCFCFLFLKHNAYIFFVLMSLSLILSLMPDMLNVDFLQLTIKFLWGKVCVFY